MMSLLLAYTGSLAVGPRFGPMLGGLIVTVSGPCFDGLSNTSTVVCKFADVETPADVIDATRAQCVLPMMLRTGRIPLALSTDGGKTYNHTGVFYLGKLNNYYIVARARAHACVCVCLCVNACAWLICMGVLF